MNNVPHDLIIAISAEIELEEKSRRIAAHIFPRGCSQGAIHIITSGLKLAHASLHGKSNLTPWRITTEWSDMYAVVQLRNFLMEDTRPTHRPRLRAWESGAWAAQNQNRKPKTKTETETRSE